MKKLFLLSTTLFLTACSSSALFVINTLSKFDNYSVSKDLAYGEDPLQRLDIYTPKGKAKGTVIFFYGGCWGACSTYTKDDYTFVAQALTSKGYSVVIPDYRIYPKVLFPQIMEDAVSVLEWTNKNVLSKQKKHKKLFLMGHSAGGHISAMLCVNKEHLGKTLYSSITGYIGLATPYDFLFDQAYQEKLFANIAYKNTQVTTFVEGDEAPFLLLYGKADTTVYSRNIEKMIQKVQEKKGSVESHIYEGINHVDILTALSLPLRWKYDVLSDIEAFLDKN